MCRTAFLLVNASLLLANATGMSFMHKGVR